MEQYYLYNWNSCHYGDVIMGGIVSQITSLMIVYSTVYSDADQRKYQSSMSLAFVRGIPQGQVNSPHKWPVTRKMFLFDDVFIVLVREHLYNDLGPPPSCMIYCTHCLTKLSFYQTRSILSMDSGSNENYHKASKIRCTLVDNKKIYHADVDGASPVGTAPTTSSFTT